MKRMWIWAWIVLAGLASPVAATEMESAKEVLAAVETELNVAVANWEYSIDGKHWSPYPLGRDLNAPVLRLRADIAAREQLAGVPVAGTPLGLTVEVYGRGLCTVTPSVDGSPRESFVVAGGGTLGQTVTRTIDLAAAVDQPSCRLELEVRNQGLLPARGDFWPPRREPLPEEGQRFVLRQAEAVYPRAAELLPAVSDWLASFQTALGLLEPELVRFTFTGIPYPIADGRLTPPDRLARLREIWRAAVLAFDLAALRQGDPDQVRASLARSYELGGELRQYAREYEVYLIGNAHIDIAWLWRMAETKLVARNTFDTVIANMAEYPELRYAQSQAVTYRWMEERYPEIFGRIADKIRTGQWEVVGGMWVEPDCNMISGESWVRQFLYGKRYFRDKFGQDVRLAWNPDSFGYNWNMPQILRKCGIDAFITQKIWWNDTTVFPYYIFHWEGADGTRLLSYFPPQGYTSRVELPRVVSDITKYEAVTGFKKSLILYGLGDHGGGPNREILDRVRHYQTLAIHPEFRHSPAGEFLKKLEPELGDRIPVWRDELYLEYHQGTFTTQAETKRNNRRAESGLAAAEKLASLAALHGADYPRARLEETWLPALTHQFHDILPGSSITPVYRDAVEAYAEVLRDLAGATDTALASLARQIRTDSAAGQPVIVWNTLSWPRSDFVTCEVPADLGPELRLVDHEGHACPLEVAPCPGEGRLAVSFVAEDVPPVGYRVYYLAAGTGAAPPGELKVDGLTLENRFHRLRLDPASGNLVSLVDRRLGREFVAPGQAANALRIYEDRPEQWDAWNIGYTGRMWELGQADSVEVVRSSPVRTVVRVRKSFLGPDKDRWSPTEEFPSSFFTQDIVLYDRLDRVEVQCEADWWESHLQLKVAIPVAVTRDRAAYEIPFAAIERTTRRETPWEKARYEVPALRWADLSDAAGGISLLNDCKYGHDIAGNVMQLSLLRSPTWPDPMADRGRHRFTYALFTHPGAWPEGDTVRRGQELNTPLIARLAGRHAGALPPEQAFCEGAPGGVILETGTPAEDGRGWIVRLYESLGRPAAGVVLRAFRPLARVEETDLLENRLREWPADGQEIRLDFGRFEIKTLRLEFRP